MKSASPLSGSATDVIHAVAIRLRALGSFGELEWAFPQLQRQLEAVARRVAAVRLRRGSVQGLEAAVAWLDQVIRDHPGLAEPAALGLKAELLRLAGRCRD